MNLRELATLNAREEFHMPRVHHIHVDGPARKPLELEPRRGFACLVDELPGCNIRNCSQPGRFDAVTIFGPWANLCVLHFHEYTIGLIGEGHGQVWFTPAERGASFDLASGEVRP